MDFEAVMSCSLSVRFLIRVCAGIACNATDVFDSATGKWSTAELSVARYVMGAVSVGRFAIFAGGSSSGRACLSRLWAVCC